MKLKKIISKKTIDLLVKSEEATTKIWNKDFDNIITTDENGNMHMDEKKLGYLITKPLRKMRPYIEAMIAHEILQYLKTNDQEYYNQVWSNMKKNKGKADIDIKKIEEKVPTLKSFNEVFGFYR